MANVSTFTANFEPFDRALKGAEVQLGRFEQTNSRVKRELQRLVDGFDGTKVISQARTMAEAVDRVGGVSKLTSGELARVRSTTEEAVAKLKALGQDVPPEIAKLQRAVQQTGVEVHTTTQKTTDWHGALRGLVAVMSVGAFARAVKSYADFGGTLTDLAAKTGMSVEGVQRLKFAAEQSGNTFDQVSMGVAQLARRLMGDDKSAVAAFDRLGLSMDELRRLDPETQFVRVADAIKAVENPTERAALAMQVFGRSGADLLPTLTAGVSDLSAKAERLGIVLSTEAAQAADELGDNLDALTTVGQVLIGQFLGPLVPLLTEVTGWMGKAANAVTWLQDGFTGLLTAGFKAQRGLYAVVLSAAEASRQIPAFGKLFGASATDVEFFRQQVRYLDDVIAGMNVRAPKAARAVAGVVPPTEDLSRASTDAAAAAKRHADAIDKLTGRDKIAAARELTRQLADLVRSGASVDPAQFATINRVMSDALDAARRLGVEVDLLWQHWYLQTVDLTMAVQDGLTPAILNLGAGLRKIQDMDPFGKVVEDLAKIERAVPGLPGGKLPGVSIGMPTAPPDLRNFWQKTFGSPRDVGGFLTTTVLQAVTGGGNVSRALGAGLGGQLATGVAQSLTKEGGKLAGTAIGGALSAALPVVGSLAGAALGGLVNKFFGPSKGAIAGKQADADIKALQDRLLQTYGSIDNIRKIGGAAGAALAAAWGSKNVQGLAHFQRLLGDFERTLEAVRTDVEALARTSAAGELVSPELLQRLLGQQGHADVQAALAAFQGSQRDAGVAGLGGFVAARAELGDLADTVLPLTERSALAAGAALAAFFEEFDSPVAALQAMGPSLTSWQAQLDAAGLSGGAAFAHISAMATLASDEIGGPVTTAMLGLGQGLTSLHNLGLLNQDTYGGLTELMGTGFASLTDKGFDVHQIMTLWRKPLQTAWELQQDFGFETDETTQALIDQAEASGLIGEKFRPAADRMAAGIEKLVDRLETFLATLTGGVTQGARTAAGALVDTFTNLRMPEVRVPVIFDVDEFPGSGGAVVHVPGAARGGIVARPTLLVAGEAGAEAIIPLDQLRSVVGAGAGDVFLDSEKVGRVIWREGATRFGAAGAW